MAVWQVSCVALASICAALVAVASWLWTNRLRTSAPGPQTVPFLGNLLHFYRLPVLSDRVAELQKQYGDVFRVYVGPKLVIVITQPEDIHRVLMTGKLQQRDPFFLHSLQKLIDNGLLTNSGEMWKRHRKLMEPAFHFSVVSVVCPLINRVLRSGAQRSLIPKSLSKSDDREDNNATTQLEEKHKLLCWGKNHIRHIRAEDLPAGVAIKAMERYLETFNKEGQLLNEKLAATGSEELDVYSSIGLCTFRSVAFAFGGLEFDRVEPDPCKQEELVTAINKAVKTFSAMLFRPWKAVQGLRWMSAEGRELKRQIEIWRNLYQRYLDLLREDISNTKVTGRAFLANIVSQENRDEPLTDDEIRSEMLTLLLAGSETTAGAICYALALLGLHPEWQEKAWGELHRVFGSGGDFKRPVTMQDLSHLIVIDAIIKESLRLFPTVPSMPRFVAEDIPLAGGRYVAPRGCCVVLAFSLMHRHPRLFPDPDKFDPGRFLPGGSATSRKSCSYLPFSSGPRRCLGGHFAIMEMKILLSAVLRRFRIIPGSTREELEISLLSITSHPLTGYRVSFVPREMPRCD